MKDRIHHLRPLRSVERPDGPSLDFALMAAVKHSERGEWQAFVTAIGDAFWVMYEGQHEDVSANRMVTLIRSFAGMEWTPPPPENGGETAA